MLTSENFLAPSQFLIYIANRQPFADTEGVTHIARKIRDYIQDDTLWYDFMLETDMDGSILSNPVPITVLADRVVSEREFREIISKQMYYFAPSTNLESLDGNLNIIQARSFVIKDNAIRPLESTSKSALGSGIYGIYVKDASNIVNLQNTTEQSVYRIDYSNPYPLQDKEHGESLTIASLNTNRYLDRVLDALRDKEVVTFPDVLELIELNPNLALFRLWNIVLYRTYDSISHDTLNEIMAQYIVDYLTKSDLLDSMNGNPIQELPINRILTQLGYDGIIADDPYNNGWNRGCVSYNYNQAQTLVGEFARY